MTTTPADPTTITDLVERAFKMGWAQGIADRLIGNALRITGPERRALVVALERLGVERGALTDVFGRQFDGEDDPRLKVAEVITRAEAEAILEHRGDLTTALRQPPESRVVDLTTLAAWMTAQGFATGHGDNLADMVRELEVQYAAGPGGAGE